MRKHIKTIVCVISALVFAFCPLLMSGCDCSGIGGGGNNGNSGDGGSTTPTYKVTDYLTGLKTAYTPAVNSTPDEALNQYANEVLGLTEILAVDTFVNLMENYFESASYTYNSSLYNNLSFSATSSYIALEDETEISYGEYSYEYSNPIYEIDPTTYVTTNKYVGFGKTITRGTNEEIKGDTTTRFNKWEVSEGFGYGTSGTFNYLMNFFTLNQYQSNTNVTIPAAYKMMYAILYISNNFYNVTTDGFNEAYATFKTHYDNIKDDNTFDWKTKCRELALSSKHSGLIADSTEERAFKQYILDYIIGTDNVNRDNEMISTYSNGEYKDKEKADVFEGEYYYYSEELVNDILNSINKGDDKCSYIDLIEIIANNNKKPIIEGLTISDSTITYQNNTYNKNDSESMNNLLTAINLEKNEDEKITLEYLNDTVITNNNSEDIISNLTVNQSGKLWQDFDGNGKVDIEWAKDSSGKELKDSNGNKIPKYRVNNPEFRNYDWTVGQIVNNVILNSNITYKAEDDTATTITGYPTVSNVFCRDYEYSAVEVDSSDLDAKYTCSLPRNAYKSILVCAKDRTGKDYLNNVGFINMVLESAEGVSVDVKIFARYYRTGVGYATWDNGVELDGEKTLFPLVTDNRGNIATQKINGPYKVQLVDGEIQDSSLEINVQDMFKNAKFNGKTNDKKFTFTYTDADSVEQSMQVYEIEPFAEGYCNTSVKQAVHASVFVKNGKTNPTYSSFTLPTGEIIYSYDSSNLQGVGDGYGYIEILFAPSNENAFTFGLLGYVPQTEFAL